MTTVAEKGTLEAMIAEMERWLGTGEPNVIQSWYRARNGAAYNGNFAWCDATVTRAAVDSGCHDSVCFGTDYAYTVAHAARFQAKGQWHAMTNGVVKSGIRRGDIIFFDWDGSSSIGAIDHVGIVTSVNGSTVYTIEGNIGNVCARKVRYVGDIAGFGRPVYKTPSKTTTETSPAAKKYRAFPGVSFFMKGSKPALGKSSPIFTNMGKALIARGFKSYYKVGAGPELGQADVNAYEAYQRSLNYTGDDAKWPPGKTSWDKLKVAE
jgi:hypothetical protein